MSEDWQTKYGRRRVRKDPPTLEEAVFAAQGITDDVPSQIEIASALIGLPPEKVREQVLKSKPTAPQVTRLIATERGPTRAVVVERRVTRRPVVVERRPTRGTIVKV